MKGFTSIELLIVIAIIGILVLFALGGSAAFLNADFAKSPSFAWFFPNESRALSQQEMIRQQRELIEELRKQNTKQKETP